MSDARALPTPARALVAATLAAGVVALALALVDVPAWGWVDALECGVLALVLVATERLPLFLPYHREEVAYALSEAVWIAALFFLRPSVLVLGVGLGLLVGQALQPWATVKLAFNVALTVATVGLAVTVFEALGAPPATEVVGWLVAVAAAVAHFVVNAVLTSGIIAAVERRPFGEVAFIPPDPLHWAGSISLGLLGALVFEVQPAALPLLLVPLALTYLGYRGWIQSARERDLMDSMAADAEGISTGPELSQRLEVPATPGAAPRLATTFNRMLDRVEAAVARERRFVREASHELRTPLTISRGYLEVLAPEPSQEELAETREVVIDELDRMTRIVEDMRALTRVEDPGSVRLAPVELGRFVGEVAAKSAGLVGGRLELDAPREPVVVRVDQQRLTQALVNLVDNAGKHTPTGTSLRFRARALDGRVRFEVADDGGGLEPGREEELFRPFVTGNGSAGSGLGLAIVAAVARAHGGAAGVENRPGAGATFWLEVPR